MRRLVSVLLPPRSPVLPPPSSPGPASSSGADPRPQAPTQPSTRATTFTPWSTYHRTLSRGGRTTHAAGTPLHRAWTAPFKNAVYGEPLVVGSTLIAATEGNKVI